MKKSFLLVNIRHTEFDCSHLQAALFACRQEMRQCFGIANSAADEDFTSMAVVGDLPQGLDKVVDYVDVVCDVSAEDEVWLVMAKRRGWL